jgi:hypothetical protein
MSHEENEPGHGDSVAAWVTVGVILLAFGLGTLFVWFEQPVLVAGSVVLAFAGLAAGYFLKKAGYGVGGAKSKG